MTENERTALLLNELSRICHTANRKWWLDLSKPCENCKAAGWVHTNFGEPDCPYCAGRGYAKKERNVGELLMLCVSELAEAMEGHRKDLMDDHLPNRKMFEVELADCLIRIFDLCGAKGLDVGRVFVEKMTYNARREDHTVEARLKEGGKAY